MWTAPKLTPKSEGCLAPKKRSTVSSVCIIDLIAYPSYAVKLQYEITTGSLPKALLSFDSSFNDRILSCLCHTCLREMLSWFGGSYCEQLCDGQLSSRR